MGKPVAVVRLAVPGASLVVERRAKSMSEREAKQVPGSGEEPRCFHTFQYPSRTCDRCGLTVGSPTPEERAAALWKRLGGDISLDGTWVTDDRLEKEFAAALRSYGDERAAEERETCRRLLVLAGIYERDRADARKAERLLGMLKAQPERHYLWAAGSRLLNVGAELERQACERIVDGARSRQEAIDAIRARGG
jgi:hypothetical protein